MIRNYTLAQIAEANTPEKAWIVIHGRVYNVSSYLDDHPGGRDVLLELAGSDATSDFDFVGHSKSAAKAMAEFQVGAVAGYTAAPERASRQQVIVSATEPQKLGSAVTPFFQNSTVRALVVLVLLSAAALCCGLRTTYHLSEQLNGPFSLQSVSVNLVMLLLLSGGALVFGMRSYWHSLFHYRGVFEYPPHYIFP
ncbi:Cytochrome b5 [Cordyceps javanica]|uniref:Cytochrome b5 n=1 Tax=Cordyceps javanica TaxID=43265 RepID=A0A545V7V7_9HYPO|nr:Cytochrome b5 [Cordyceps javanica]TQW09031.1 Cytochrome b5 [Cordyceps javanica]